ncbi:MAG TPA: DUF2889 domain-containing protein [Acetobacteraceae bacterium]|nr:DUF2889 domain-containing protein [Acetobacteraceae bacterium]
MPLSPPAERELLHTRAITLHGYRRTDGLYDIEARLTDTKTQAVPSQDRGMIAAGEPLHGMWMRMTVDEQMRIVQCEAATDHGPYAVCPQAAPNFARLAGLTIRGGFLKEAAARVGGPAGCTHLRELLQQVATTAIQTLYSVKAKQEANSDSLDRGLLNTCLAYGTDSPVVQRRWPHLYTGRAQGIIGPLETGADRAQTAQVSEA